MPSSAAIRLQIETTLANRVPAALTLKIKQAPELFATRIVEVDAVLDGGIPRGCITEVAGAASTGKTSFGLSAIAAITQSGAACAWVDVSDTLSPESAAAAGVELKRLLWLRTSSERKQKLTEYPSDDEGEHQEQIQKALASFDKLLSLMLDSPRGKADPSMVYQLTEYVCDRLEPDNQIVSEYLSRLIAFFMQTTLYSSARQQAADAILIWAAQLSASPSDSDYAAKYARRRLLAVEARTSGTEPAIDPLSGFSRILAPGCDFGKLWSDIGSVVTIQEEIRQYQRTPMAERNRSSFSYLGQYSELFEPLSNGRSHYRILAQYSDVCPICSLSLPTADAMKLREHGIVRHLSHLLLCEEY